ncbi:AAA family ATPase [Serratia marcescens]|uniref:AAA family ATPase n=1 Tax=Serratia marcescens TaxID=615 RepID=UPI001419C9C8|nr:AAA family ATPase [Serratia marcescens]
MILKYVLIKKYLWYKDFNINFDNKYDFVFEEDEVTLSIVLNENNVPDDFFSHNIDMSCLIGGNGSGKTCIMTFLASLGGESSIKLDDNEEYRAVFFLDDIYYVLTAKGKERTLRSGSAKLSRERMVVTLAKDNIEKMNMYESYYLSSNNTNMIKSGFAMVENDFSVGNEKRYKGLHNTEEALHFIKCVPFDGELGKMCNEKKIRLVISDRWLGMLNLSRYLNNSNRHVNLTREIKKMKKVGSSELILARMIILRVISSNHHKKDSILNRFNSEASGERNKILSEIDSDFLNEYKFEYGVFRDGFLEDMSRKLSAIMKVSENEITLDFSLSDESGISVLRELLEISLKNEIYADGYKYYFYPPFSTGQWKRVELACKINDISSKAKHGSYLNLFIDEPDADLHPEMQTKLVSWMIRLMSKRDNHFNILISSHNPLILSDFPRRRVVFIGGGNAKNNKDKTLGANVYDLYKNSFLVTNAISDFVREKIEDSIAHKKIDDLSFLINEVSEPLIVRALVSHFDKITHTKKNDNHRLTTFIGSLSEAERAFLKRELNNE